MKSLIIFVLVLILIVFVTLYFTVFDKNGVTSLDSDEFESLIQDKKVFVLQAHVPYMGEIDGTDLIMEKWEEPSYYIEQLPKDKSTPIAVYCRSGRMSAMTSEKLLAMGYQNVYDLEGGMKAWLANGKDLIGN